MAQQRGHYENHVSLSDEKNSLGWRKLRVNWQYSQEDKDAVDAAATPIMDALEEAGFGHMTRLDAKKHTENYSCHHASGTTRMSADPMKGVVDADCRVHDHPNLYIVGMSVFPSVGYANPTLSIMALGVRLADHIVAS
jgi:choline dehydrogenase-like flavoprotein